MNEPFLTLRTYLKRGIAGILFLVMFLGAGAAALSLLAAGINTLSGMATTRMSAPPAAATGIQQPPSEPTGTSSGHNTENAGTAQGSPVGGSNSSMPDAQNGAHQMSYVDALNSEIDHMHSPIGESLDYGGVALGEQVQQTFGSVLSGVLKALFLEQNGAPTDGGHP